MEPSRAALIGLFESKPSEYVTETGCLLWGGCWGHKGYGYLTIQQLCRRAHRMMWYAYRGDIPDGLFVLHKCDTPCCINLDHLWLGTHEENMADMDRKGRRRAWGQRYPKIPDEKVRAIRAGPKPTKEIAKKYGISRFYAVKVWRGLARASVS